MGAYMQNTVKLRKVSPNNNLRESEKELQYVSFN